MGSAICKQKHHKSTYIRPRKRGGREAGDGLFWAPRSNLGENLAAATPCSARDMAGDMHMGIQRPDARLVIRRSLTQVLSVQECGLGAHAMARGRAGYNVR